MTAENESDLIGALKQRDRSAWRVAVDRHLAEVYGFVFHLVGGDRAVAEDLNQETWLEALHGIERCDAARGTFRNWLFGIARRRVAGYYRRQGVGKLISLGTPFSQGDEPQGLALLPEDILEQVEQRAVVRAALLVLAEDRRQALLWKYVEGLSVVAIALRMEKTAKAVESLLTRAREQMRGLLHGYLRPRDPERRASKEASHE